ncbi:rhamnogalacturonan-hydrolase [Gloeopeniophorella convolvens]|nr:rhamnogalacturonan-hydrolase [Gloeopeniophorella convolvens]
MLSFTILALFLSLSPSVFAQLTTTVGPTTPSSAKRNVICNVLDYGGSIGSSDIGPAINSTYNNCVLNNEGSTLYIPQGNYNMVTWVTLSGGTQWAIQLDGLITRTGTSSGHMFAITDATDFEFYSSTSAGGIQGNGYQARNAGPRLIRMITSTSYSVHDLILVDSPEFHLIIDNGSRGEVYNLAIRGGSDGIDVSGTNHWIHDVEVTNRDECVTIKSPAHNIMVERIWCNQSGGSAFGSLGTGVDIANVVYQNIYTNGGNQAMMFKSNGGNGTVSNVLLQNFISRGTAYGLYLNQYWASISPNPGNGVQLTNITFMNWDGDVVDGVARSPLALLCADGAPCSSITLQNVNMWSQSGQALAKCESAFGSGVGCIRDGDPSSYAASTSTMAEPAGYTTPPSLPGDLTAGFTSVSPIPTPTIPTTFFPGLPQISPLAKNK